MQKWSRNHQIVHLGNPKCELAAVAPVLNRVLESTGVTHKNRPNFDAVVFVCGSLGKKQESENESCCQDFFTDSLCWALFKRGIYVIIYLLLYNNYIVIIVVFAHSMRQQFVEWALQHARRTNKPLQCRQKWQIYEWGRSSRSDSVPLLRRKLHHWCNHRDWYVHTIHNDNNYVIILWSNNLLCSYLSISHYTCVKHHKSCNWIHEVHVLLLAVSFECGCNNI